MPTGFKPRGRVVPVHLRFRNLPSKTCSGAIGEPSELWSSGKLSYGLELCYKGPVETKYGLVLVCKCSHLHGARPIVCNYIYTNCQNVL